MSTKAIQTRYKGYHFRSRLEARWAVFFDCIGVKWLYEPQGFTLKSGENYLPDFYLPEIDTWLEVKGCSSIDIDTFNYDGAIKVIDFLESTGKRIFVLGHIPDSEQLKAELDNIYHACGYVSAAYPRHLSNPDNASAYTFHVRDCCELIVNDWWDENVGITEAGGEFSNYYGAKEDIPCERCGAKKWRHSAPFKAFKSARSARFEHGENGAT